MYEPDSEQKTNFLAKIDGPVNSSEGGSDSGGGSWSDYEYIQSQLDNTWHPKVDGHSREATPTPSEYSAVEGVVSYTSNDGSAPASLESVFGDSCHEDGSWVVKKHQRALDNWERERLDESFGARPTYPQVQDTHDSLPTACGTRMRPSGRSVWQPSKTF
ncbi:hypothetical protein F5883DRAFT_204632 [Diaporthe sp. PMI_573]|nr:hypothetical protein F5883DRAFT_204632 [Diaporthaceae sp. PMI_573]